MRRPRQRFDGRGGLASSLGLATGAGVPAAFPASPKRAPEPDALLILTAIII